VPSNILVRESSRYLAPEWPQSAIWETEISCHYVPLSHTTSEWQKIFKSNKALGNIAGLADTFLMLVADEGNVCSIL
jgi:hypothetical protein